MIEKVNTMATKTLWCMTLGCVSSVLFFCAQVNAKPIKLIAYINHTSGCQTHTETFLAELVKKYDGKVTLEIVDFGGKGKKRWLADGMHCMGIQINGGLQHNIWAKGVEIPISFKMPAGYMWTHEDLDILVRQLIEGISSEDRKPPSMQTTVTGSGAYALQIDSKTVLELDARKSIVSLVDALTEASLKSPILQEEFSIALRTDMVCLSLRDKTIAELPVEALGLSREDAPQKSFVKLNELISAFPRKARPFQGMKMPFRRK